MTNHSIQTLSILVKARIVDYCMFTSKVRLSSVDNLSGSIVKGDELITFSCVLCVVDKHSL